jgi:hypothetical protein
MSNILNTEDKGGSVSLPSLMGYTRARTSGSVLQGIPWQRGKTIFLENYPYSSSLHTETRRAKLSLKLL